MEEPEWIVTATPLLHSTIFWCSWTLFLCFCVPNNSYTNIYQSSFFLVGCQLHLCMCKRGAPRIDGDRGGGRVMFPQTRSPWILPSTGVNNFLVIFIDCSIQLEFSAYDWMEMVEFIIQLEKLSCIGRLSVKRDRNRILLQIIDIFSSHLYIYFISTSGSLESEKIQRENLQLPKAQIRSGPPVGNALDVHVSYTKQIQLQLWRQGHVHAWSFICIYALGISTRQENDKGYPFFPLHRSCFISIIGNEGCHLT